ncbi:MAG: hypothetical protein HQM01_11835 [Magnetococcales bacterium]|nr:hypothetical protein [Magnetococcales bacterium]
MPPTVARKDNRAESFAHTTPIALFPFQARHTTITAPLHLILSTPIGYALLSMPHVP